MTQPDLFECSPSFRFKGAGHRRTHTGAIMEQVACALMGFARARIDGRKEFCPDAHAPGDKPVEIKSVHINGQLNGKSPLYAFRMRKEARCAPELAYLFVCHMGTGKGKAKTAADLLDRLEAGPLILGLFPAWAVHRAAFHDCKLCKSPKPKVTGSKRPGYTRPGYSEGYYNLPIGPFLRNAPRSSQATAALWGRTFSAEILQLAVDPWSLDPSPASYLPE